jgi:hypothetical protein
MAVDITALYCCLDDFCKVFADWEAHRLLPSEQPRQRSGKLSRAEMLFIVVLFHLSPYKNFKVFHLSPYNRTSRCSTSTASAVSIAPALTSCRTMTGLSA